MTALNDLIRIPSEVHKSDFVMSLKGGVSQADATLDAYVVTAQLADCFDTALALIGSAIEEGSSKGTYLHGSFGSGKSHFMAVLDLLLRGNETARAKPELAPVIAKHDARLSGRRFLQVPYHFVGAGSIEEAVFGGYVNYVVKLHPGAALPAVFAGDQILADAKEMRGRLGDEAFFTELDGGEDDDEFGAFAAGWTPAEFDRAVAEGPSSADGRRLIADLVATFFTAYQRQGDMVDFGTGLDALSQHAKGLGYDGVILFLDELILWLATHLSNLEFVTSEASKLAKLVEASKADRPVPIISFIARQRDLTDFVGVGLPGAAATNLGDHLKHLSGRFGLIELEDSNLPEIVAKRLLKPKGQAEAQALDDAFDTTWRQATAARDALLTSHGDREDFRRVYPFSPALIDALVAVSSYLQRERTALRLLLQLLVDKRDTLEVGDIVPLGDLWDQIAQEDAFSPQLKQHFDRARVLYRRLRNILLAEHGLTDEQAKALPDKHLFRTDERLVKTLLLSALVPEVEPLRNLTVSRLAALNHGTIATPIPGQERTVVLQKLTKLAEQVAEIRVEHGTDPQVSLKLTGVDTAAVLDQARSEDSPGARRAKIRELLADGFNIEMESSPLPPTHKWVWRGSRREADIRFGNVRDRTELPDAEFRAGAHPKLIIDYPFDDGTHTPADDRARVQRLVEEGERSATVCWLPLFLTETSLDRLGNLVVLDYVLTGDRFETYTTHMSPQDRTEARTLLRNQADTLRSAMHTILQQAYGLTTADDGQVQPDLSPGEQFPTLDPTLTVRPPTSASLADALPQVLDQMMGHQHPKHPQFESEVKIGELKTCLALIEQAVSQPNMRLDNIATGDRKAMRKVLAPLRLATTGEAHLVLERHWYDHFQRKQNEESGPVTVERLKRWIDLPDSHGLESRVANLVISAYALMDDRVMMHGGQPVHPTVERLDDAVELRTQTLPEPEEWDDARPRAAAIFGVTGAPLRSAASVAQLVADLRVVADEYREPARQVLTQLTSRAGALGISGDSNRIRTARAVVALLDGLNGGEDHQAVAVLAGASVPTSDEALGRSMKSSAAVAGRLRSMNAQLIGSATALGGDHAAAATTLAETLAAKARRDELVTPLADALDDAEAAATELLGRAARPDPGPGQIPVPDPTPPGKPDVIVKPHGGEEIAIEIGASGDTELRETREMSGFLSAMLRTVEDLESLRIVWKRRDEA